MFVDVSSMAARCAAIFTDCVNDEFGNSIVTDVLDPICSEIASLRALHDEYTRTSIILDQISLEIMSIPCNIELKDE